MAKEPLVTWLDNHANHIIIIMCVGGCVAARARHSGWLIQHHPEKA